MDHCHENVKRNLGASPALWHSCTFAPFLWGTNPRSAGLLEPPYDLVVATDPYVKEETRDAFLHACRSVAGPHTLIIIAFQVRTQAVYDSLLVGLDESGFEYGEVHPMRLARAARLTGYSGNWIPLIIARLAVGAQGETPLAAELPVDEVERASAAAEPGFSSMPRAPASAAS